MTGLFQKILSVFLLMVGFCCSSSFGQVPNGTYKIVARHSGQVLTAAGEGTVNQTPLIAYPYSDMPGKQWVLTSLGNGQYKLMGVGSGKCINVYNGGTADNDPIRLYDWNNLDNFKFTISATSDGYYRLIFVNSGKALAVKDSVTSFGGEIVQKTVDPSSESSQWRFVPLNDGAAAAPDFTMVALPDTQAYAGSANGGTPQMFYDQTGWINNNRLSRNIKYVAGLGDIVNKGVQLLEWQVARNALYALDDTVPYGTVPGNHDFDHFGIEPSDFYNTATINYNNSFGVSHFESKGYYGGHYGDNNDSHYDLISAGGMDFIIVYMVWRMQDNYEPALMDWVNDTIKAYPYRRAIVVSHELLRDDGTFKPPGRTLYDKIKGNSNLFLIMCGHVGGDSSRTDIYNGNKVTSMLVDYQGETNGGNGKMRLLKFRPSENLIECTTYSPTTNLSYSTNESGGISRFTIPYDMQNSGSLSKLPSYYMIVNKATGKVIDLNGGVLTDGALTNQYSYNYNAPNERWAFSMTEREDHFRIVSAVSGKVLSVENNSTADNAQVLQWTYNGIPAQQWDLVDAGDGWYKIKNVNSGKVIEVANSSTANEAKVQQKTDVNGDNQKWRLQPWGDYYIRTFSGKYISVQNGGSSDGSPIVQFTGDPSAWFKWRFESAGDGYLKVSSLNILSKTASVASGSTAKAAELNLYNYSGAAGQKIVVRPQTNGRTRFFLPHSGMYWDVRSASPVDNRPIQQYTDNPSAAQLFNLERVP